jgi:hypothetical protein|tara:strand:- start:66 stop:659 length:594 start_codon:yes stop_codon:yes gene_type:complete
MAKKTRIDRRGKIRSIVKPWSFTKNKPHWSITKRAAVNRRRRIVDEVWHTDNVTVTDAIVPHLERFITEILSLSDVANINGEKIIINSQVVTDTGGISKNFQQPANASGISLSDSVGFELGTLSSVFNTGKVNDMLFNAVGYDQEFLTDSITAGDAVSLAPNSGQSETVSVGDSIGFQFLVGSMLNSSVINLSQFNS